MIYLWVFELLPVAFDEALGLPVAHDPVEEVERVLLIDGVAGDAQPVDDYGHGREDDSGGEREVEVGGEGEEAPAHSCPQHGQAPPCAEGPVEVGADAGVDGLVEIELMLVDFAYFLLALEDLERE